MSDGQMILLMFFILITFPIIGVYIVYRVNKYNRAQKNKKYTGEVEGEIIKTRLKGGDVKAWVATVQYQVNGTTYSITESLKVKTETIKIGVIPIGQQKTPKIGEGKIVTIKFNPDNPSEAIIKGNDGFLTG